MTPYDFAISTAASRRLTRLITKDEITRPLRENDFTERHEKLSYLLQCPFCVSVYTSAGVVLSRMLFPRASNLVLTAFAIAEVQATLTEIEEQRQALVENYGPPL